MFFLLLCLAFTAISFHIITSFILLGKSRLPPGPRGWPIIGDILLLRNKPHQALANLSKTYGPIMSLRLGNITTIVISSPSMAKECLHKHDQALSARKVPISAQVDNHHQNSMAWLPAEANWRNLRKITSIHMLSQQKVDASESFRHQKIQQLLSYIEESCDKSQAIDIGQAAFTTTLNLMSDTIFSIDLASYQSTFSQGFSEIIWGLLEEAGRPNVADYFPILRFLDLQGCYKRGKIYYTKLDQILVDMIEKRLELKKASSSEDVLDSLISVAREKDSKFNFSQLRYTIIDLFVAGTETTSSTIEWAMAELLLNPEKMLKAKAEVRELLGNRRGIGELDITRLPYLQAVVKETFRLHPPGPFLVPRKAVNDVQLSGYVIPKNSQILINVWAIGHDLNIWDRPYDFIPERFTDNDVDVKGLDFELIPFGAGRRICPGMSFALRTLHLVLASLINSFDWKLIDAHDKLDMSEKFGLTLRKALPLLAIPVKIQE